MAGLRGRGTGRVGHANHLSGAARRKHVATNTWSVVRARHHGCLVVEGGSEIGDLHRAVGMPLGDTRMTYVLVDRHNLALHGG